jgi:hypothetical protein
MRAKQKKKTLGVHKKYTFLAELGPGYPEGKKNGIKSINKKE